MFTCERCGKEFTEKTNLTRHMKTHLKDPTVSGQTYSCGVCDKVFSPADNRNKHEVVHSYSLTCEVCGQYFNRMDSLARHCAQHETPDGKQRLPMKRPVAPEPGPSPKQRRTVSPPPRDSHFIRVWCQLVFVTVESLVQCYANGGRFDRSRERRKTRELEISSGRRRLLHHQSPSTDNSHQEALRP